MTRVGLHRAIAPACGLIVLASVVAGRAATLDFAAPPGANYDKAEFRLWLPDEGGPVRALVILVPGSNGDGRPMVDDEFWRAFAARHRLGLVGCRITDKPHDQMFIEHYVEVSKGTGQAFLDALTDFAGRSNHPEIAGAPLLLWGMSAGGEFNYELTAWKPERVVAFVVNKGNIYYTALAPAEARRVPGLLFVGEKDLEFRNHTIAGLFAVNRRAGALWGFAEEPGVAHAVGRSRDLAAIFFEDMLAARLPAAAAATPASGPAGLRPLDEKAGYLGDLKNRSFRRVGDSKPPTYPTAWLPTERVARAWQAIVTAAPMAP
jgi:dienelactone hydrolase